MWSSEYERLRKERGSGPGSVIGGVSTVQTQTSGQKQKQGSKSRKGGKGKKNSDGKLDG